MENDSDLVYRKFDERWKSGDQEGALAFLDEAIRLEPQNLAHYLTRGTVKAGPWPNEHEEAIADFSFVIERSLNDEEKEYAYRNRVVSYITLKQYNNALRDLNWLINNDFGDDFLIDLRSECNREVGHFAESIQDYTYAINHRKTNNLLLGRAKTYIQMSNFEAAFEDLSQLDDLEKDESSWLERAQLYYRIKRYEEAILDFTKLTTMNSDPGYQSAMYRWRGHNYYCLNKLEDALVDFTQTSLLAGKPPLDTVAEYVEYLRIECLR